jgi:AraC-like DNA-binding protein
MQTDIKRYPVRHPLLKNYIRFFWELYIDYAQLNHKIIPQRNINLRFNLSETPQYACTDGKDHLLENVFFSGLHDNFKNTNLKMNGKVHMLGVCFFPDGFYPFFKIPVSEFKNQLLGACEIGFKLTREISEKLFEANGAESRLDILENDLLLILVNSEKTPEKFRQIFNTLKQIDNSRQITEFCHSNNIGIRNLERMYNKYVGVSANTYATLNRFHKSLNQLLYNDYSRLSDLAYDNGYFDQMHFIKEFRRFTGNTPKSFVHQKDSILQIGKLS